MASNSKHGRGFPWPKPFIQEPIDTLKIELKQSSTQWSAICLFTLSLAGFATQVVVALNFYLATITTVSWAAAVVHITIWRPRTGSVLLFVDFVGTAGLGACFIASLYDNLGSRDAILMFSGTALAVTATFIVANMPLRDPSMSRTNIGRPKSTPSNALRSPEDSLTLLQWMTVSWLSPLIALGNKRQINDEDVWLLPYEFQHSHLHDRFRELQGSVVRRLFKANWIDLVILTILAIVELGANYSAPVILQKLLQSMEHLRTEKRSAIIWASLILAVRLIAAQSSVFSLWFGRRCYERSRGEMITMLYEKTLNRKIFGGLPQRAENDPSSVEQPAADRSSVGDSGTLPETEQLLSGQYKRPKSVASRAKELVQKSRSFFRKKTEVDKKVPASMGKILNLMRNDAYEVAQRFWEFQTLINKPFGLILSIILIWQLLGWSCFVGVAVVVIAQILNYLLARVLISWEKRRRKATDVKLQKIGQYIESIRHLRWYGWHFAWLDGVMTARQRELNLRIITSLLNSTIKFLSSFVSGMLPVATFYAYTITAGHELRVDVAFPALQLFGLLQTNIRELPNLITVLLNASVAVGRISDFIAEPDKTDDAEAPQYTDDRLELQNATFSWPGSFDVVLHDLNISFPQGLTVIFGEVAAGKTALLQALLGELDMRQGHLFKPQTPIGYCSQTPWLESMSIRESILFNSPYDDSRYKKTLEACALLPDLASFKHGDFSEIGENGIGLSGGQKARVALARAVYSRTKILFLDDPLSALDQQSAEWIVTRCLCGSLMEGRTVVLVTHRTDICQHLATQLVEVAGGTAMLYRSDDALSKFTSSTVGDMQADVEVNGRVDEWAAVPNKFVEEEHRAHGGVQMQVYWEYIKAGTLRWWSMVVLTAAICRVVYVAETWFLKEWGEAYNKAKIQILSKQIFDSDLRSFGSQSPESSTSSQIRAPMSGHGLLASWSLWHARLWD